MATTTPRLGLRQPALTDPDDVPADLAQITGVLDAAAIDAGFGAYTGLPPAAKTGRYYYATDRKQLLRDDGSGWTVVGQTPAPEVTSLPTAGLWDGMVVDLVVQTSPVRKVWRLKYRAASPAGQRWEAVGGTTPIVVQAEPGSISTTGWLDLTGMTLTLPAVGVYAVTWGMGIGAPSATTATFTAALFDGANTQYATQTIANGSLGGTSIPGWSGGEITATNTTLKARGQVTAGTWTLTRGRLIVTPVAIGG